MEEWALSGAEVELWTTSQLTLRHVRGHRVPRRVRRFVTAVLDGRVDTDTVWRSVEIVNELVINLSRMPRRTRAVVRVNVRPGRIALTVQDDGPGAIPWPVAMAPTDAEGGRGLAMVGILADRIQIFDVSPAGKALTALIDI